MARYSPRVASPNHVYHDGPELDLYSVQGTDRYPVVLERWHRFRANLEEQLCHQLQQETEEETSLTRWTGRVLRYDGTRGWGVIEDCVGARFNVNINGVLKDSVFGRRGFASGLMVRFTPMTGPRGPWAAAVQVEPPVGSDYSRQQEERTGRTKPGLVAEERGREVPWIASKERLSCAATVSPPEEPRSARTRAVMTVEVPRQTVSEPSDGAVPKSRPRGVNWAELVFGNESPEEEDAEEIVVEYSARRHSERTTEWQPAGGWFRATTFETVVTTVAAWVPPPSEQSSPPSAPADRTQKVPKSPPLERARVPSTPEAVGSSLTPASTSIRRRRVPVPTPPRIQLRPKQKPD